MGAARMALDRCARSLLLTSALAFVAMRSGGQTNDVYIYGTVTELDAKGSLQEGVVRISDLNDTSFSRLATVGRKGRFEFHVPFDRAYRIDFQVHDLIPRHALLDLRGVPAEERKGGYGININVPLVRRSPELDNSLFDRPAGRARYEPALRNIVWDQELLDALQIDWEAFKEQYRTAKRMHGDN